MKTLRKMDLDSMERELKVLQNPEKYLGGYTEAEFDMMCNNGTWSGGYVDGYYYGPCVTIYGSIIGAANGLTFDDLLAYLKDGGKWMGGYVNGIYVPCVDVVDWAVGSTGVTWDYNDASNPLNHPFGDTQLPMWGWGPGAAGDPAMEGGYRIAVAIYHYLNNDSIK